MTFEEKISDEVYVDADEYVEQFSFDYGMGWKRLALETDSCEQIEWVRFGVPIATSLMDKRSA